MSNYPAITATFGEVEILKALWDLQQRGTQAKFVSDIHRAVTERRRKVGLPEPAVTTVANTIRNGVSKGVFIEMIVAEGQLKPLIRTAEVRSSLASSRAAQKVAYEPDLTPDQVFPQMLRELASLIPNDVRADMALQFLGRSATVTRWLRKLPPS